MKNPSRTVVIHAADRAYAEAVADALDVRQETVFVHPSRLIADPVQAERAADGWLDVADKLLVYADVPLDEAAERLVRTAQALGLKIENRNNGWRPGIFRRLMGRAAAITG